VGVSSSTPRLGPGRRIEPAVAEDGTIQSRATMAPAIITRVSSLILLFMAVLALVPDGRSE
jgi:hypothetical protein